MSLDHTGTLQVTNANCVQWESIRLTSGRISVCHVIQNPVLKARGLYLTLNATVGPSQQTQNIYIAFVQSWTNVEDVEPTLYT